VFRIAVGRFRFRRSHRSLQTGCIYWQQAAFNFRYLDTTSRLEKEEKEKFKYRTSRIHTSPYKVFTRKGRSTEQHDKFIIQQKEQWTSSSKKISRILRRLNK
jgi:hypothetical protein